MTTVIAWFVLSNYLYSLRDENYSRAWEHKVSNPTIRKRRKSLHSQATEIAHLFVIAQGQRQLFLLSQGTGFSLKERQAGCT